MESTTKSSNIVYTKDQMLEIREAFIAVGDPSKYPIINSVISRDPEKRPHFRKHKPTGDGITIPNRTPRRNEHYAGSYEPNGDGSVPHSAGWRRTRRTSGASVPQSPLDGHSAHRNNSGSSNSEENGNNSVTEGSGQFRREFDWTLGCGKWRHRSTSGSERLGHKGGFFVSAGRGRGRGGGNGVGGNDGNGGGFTGPPRGRGFMRRPFQHGAAGPSRGGARGGLRHSPFNNLGSDHGPKEEDFEPQDERHLQQYQHFPPHSQHQFHRHDAGGPCDGGQLHQEKQEEVPSSLDNHAQTQVSVSNRPSEQVHEHTPQFTSPLHHAPDISTNNPTETAATNAPGGAGYTFMSSNSPPLPPHLLKLQSSPGQTGLCETQAPLPTMWYYRDPHSNIHGPFNDATMRAWYEAGYFKSGIEMRRECDKVFSKLSEYESRLGGHPFINSRSLAPIENPLPNSTTLQPTQQSMINPLGSILSSPLSGVIASGLPISMDLLRPPILTQQHQAMRSSQQASSSSIQDPTSWFCNPFSNLASKTLFDLASMSQMTLMDMLRLRQIAQLAANSASQPSGSAIDEKTIADALAALNIGLPVNATPQTPLQSVSFPPNVIDLQQLEAAIHRRQQEEEEAQKRADAGDRAGQHQEQELEAAKLTEVEKDPIEKEVTAPQLQKKRKDKAKKVVSAQEEQQKLEDESKQSTAPFVEQQEQQPTATTTTSASKKKKRKSKNASAGAAAETKPDEVEKGTAVNTDFIEPEDGWVAVPPSGSTFTPQPLPQNATLWHQQENTGRDQPSRKSKRKKGKLSAAELQQQAWEQEEERRRKANAERIAREEAEQAALAAALAEEEAAGNVATSSNAKMTAAARRQLEEAQRARQQQLAREAAKKEAETILASFKLPPTAKWGGANKNVAGVATSSMADILASQMQEEEFESMKPNAGHATFASKVASGTHAHQPTPSKTAGKPKFFVAVDGQSSTQAATKQQQPIKQPAKSSQKAPPAIPSKISKASQSAAVAPKALNVTSIWNMAVDINSTAKSANTKKDRKKKKTNANSNLLTGSIISLTPKARQELEKWCENKLSAFQPGNVDIPTLISVLCDMEEDQDVLECIESSFGKSQRVSNFSKAFVEKRATLMGATA